MSKPPFQLDPAIALAFLGQTVLVELRWDGDDEMLWRCYHIVGVVLPVPGIFEHGYFLIMPFDGSEDLPLEVYFDSINAIQTIRDRHAPGKLLERLPLPQLIQAQVDPTQGERRHA